MKTTERQREKLREYLGRFLILKRRAEEMEARAEKLASVEAKDGAEGPHSPRVTETGKLLQAARAEALGELNNILTLVGKLPAGDPGREVIELRHIDGLTWDEIGQRMRYTRTPLNKFYSAALGALLQDPETAALVEGRKGRKKRTA